MVFLKVVWCAFYSERVHLSVGVRVGKFENNSLMYFTKFPLMIAGGGSSEKSEKSFLNITVEKRTPIKYGNHNN